MSHEKLVLLVYEAHYFDARFNEGMAVGILIYE